MKTTHLRCRIILFSVCVLMIGACASKGSGLPMPAAPSAPADNPASTEASATVLPAPELPLKKLTNSLGMQFVLIPPGEFVMGSPLTEAERRPDETEHRVAISAGYYIQTTEVTQGQWKQVMSENPSYFNACGNDCPVETVSWEDIQAFIGKLNLLKGDGKYRLPTEAEWEYAARAGTKTPFAFGQCLSTDQANYNDSMPEALYEGCPGGGVARRKTIPVASLASNPWGIYDMHGNVWEWCRDWMGVYPSQLAVDPVGPESGEKRIYRGGGQNDRAGYCRSALRGQFKPDRKSGSLGFRLVLSHSPAS